MRLQFPWIAGFFLIILGEALAQPADSRASGSSVIGSIEHPKPHFQRKNWKDLNGYWDHAVVPKGEEAPEDSADGEFGSGNGKLVWTPILVPFCPEASLSGAGRLIGSDETLWYQRKFEAKRVVGERTLLHFGAVDYESAVWVNGKEVGSHIGGHTPFSFDITSALADDGKNTVTVRVRDATEGWQLRGKQAQNPKRITYTRVSGIWQTVWMEQVPERYVENLDVNTLVGQDLQQKKDEQAKGASGASLSIKAALAGTELKGESLRVVVSSKGQEVATTKGDPGNLVIGIPDPKWWTPDTPHLYDLDVELLDGAGKVVDTVKSYTALRTVGKIIDANGSPRIALNGKEVFLYGPLDQGWWPDGLLTPPSEEAMVADLEYIKAAGFNMIRKHVKVEPARYYYHCDRLGIAVWQDQVNAGMWERDEPAGASPKWTRLSPNPKDAIWPEEAHKQWVKEYKEMVDALRDHPSILIWCPFNEAWGQHNSMEIGKMAMEYDPTRLVCLASGGNFWPVGDIASQHSYPDPRFPIDDPRFKDMIKVVGEMGGHGLVIPNRKGVTQEKYWSYSMADSPEDWQNRYKGIVSSLINLRDAGVSAAVYTQTSDVETEVNGFMTYDRFPKVSAAWLKSVHDAKIQGRSLMGPQSKRKP